MLYDKKEELQEIREGQELRKEPIGVYGHYAVDRDLSLDEIKEHLKKIMMIMLLELNPLVICQSK